MLVGSNISNNFSLEPIFRMKGESSIAIPPHKLAKVQRLGFNNTTASAAQNTGPATNDILFHIHFQNRRRVNKRHPNKIITKSNKGSVEPPPPPPVSPPEGGEVSEFTFFTRIGGTAIPLYAGSVLDTETSMG